MKLAKLFLSVLFAVSLALSAQAGTLENVKKADALKCGIHTGLAGFAAPDTKGKWEGIDVDVCRAVAAAVLGDADKVKYVSMNATDRFTALTSGEIDLLSRNTTWTLTRDASLGLNFTGVSYYDGQGFLIKKQLGVKSAKELDGASVCIQSGTTTELNLADYFRTNKMKFTPITYENSDQVKNGFESGRCDVLTSDQSQLYAMRIKLKNPRSAFVLPEVISKEPLGPVVRQGDDIWFNIVKWSFFAAVIAEEQGVTSKNVDKMKKSKNPAIQRLLGVTGKGGANLKIGKDWAYNIIKQVGNYGEIFERNVGKGSALKISRGLNALWSKGGLQYAPPIR